MSTKRGVPKAIREQLAIDIEDGGGINSFDSRESHALAKIINRKDRRHVHPPKSDKDLRKKIRNLVYNQWKQFPRDKCYKKVLIPIYKNRTETSPNDTSESNEAAFNHTSEPKAADNESIISSPSRDTDEASINSFQPEVTVESSCPRPVKKSLKKNKKTTMTNKLGKKFVIQLAGGIHFVILWVDSKLSNLELKVAPDGLSVVQRSKVPQPVDTGSLLSHCGWSNDKNNKVVSVVDDIITKLKAKQKDEWTDVEVISLEEEVVRAFVDVNGVPTNKIGYNGDGDGRQIITFFLKSAAHQSVPGKGMFSNDKDRRSPGGMNVHSDSNDDTMFEEETVMEDVREELKAEMQAEFNAMASQMQEMMQTMYHDMAKMAQQQQQQQQQQQPPAPSSQHQHGGPVPDGAPSYGAGQQY